MVVVVVLTRDSVSWIGCATFSWARTSLSDGPMAPVGISNDCGRAEAVLAAKVS